MADFFLLFVFLMTFLAVLRVTSYLGDKMTKKINPRRPRRESSNDE